MPNQSTTNSPNLSSTAVLLFGLLVSFAFKGEGEASEVARFSAVLVGATLVISFVVELVLTNFRNLIRLDVSALVALYFLTLFEFLFPQDFFNELVTKEQAIVGIDLVLLGMSSLAVGRHFVSPKPLDGVLKRVVNLTDMELFLLAIVSFSLGHLHMWVAVGFNPIEWINQMLGARFSQSWQRGKLGGLNTLLTELHWMNCLVPAIAAIFFTKVKQVPKWIILVLAILLLLVFFGGVSLGSRYQFAFYLISFIGGFFLALPQARTGKMLFFLVPIFLVFLLTCFVVVNFRNLGVRETFEAYVLNESGNYHQPRKQMLDRMFQEGEFKFIIDRNLYPISMLPEYFPDQHPFLESEILLHILIRPVPRVLWPGKPESLSVTTEEILGINSATIASTFIGEAFMAYGRFGVVLFGLILGVLTGFWNRIPVPQSHPTMILIYATGFIWIALAIRSVVWISLGFFPCIALLGYIWIVVPLMRSAIGDEAVEA